MLDFLTKRDRITIIAEILNQCKKPIVKTQIMYRAGVNYSINEDLLSYLQKIQMLKLNGTKYKTTKKGYCFVRKYFEIQEILS